MEALFRILLVLLATAEENANELQVMPNPHQEHYWRAKASSKSHLYSCEELCTLCLFSAPTVCRRSMDELTANCNEMQPDLGQPKGSSCTGRKKQYCIRHLTIVEHFLSSKRGYWCRHTVYEPTNYIYKSEGRGDKELLNRCMKFLKSRNFWMVNQNPKKQCPRDHLQYNLPPSKLENTYQWKGNIKENEDFQEGTKTVTPQDGLIRRTTRSPAKNISDGRIQQWKTELSTELAQFSRVLPAVSCNAALHDLCLSHISCRELWKLFRQSCIVDAQNQCQMTNRNDCWQSFEGISWTGLGTCSCLDNNSDCHWIRLQTNYNKCIYEISVSGEMGPARSIAHGQGLPLANGNYPATAPFSYYQRYYFTSTPSPVAITTTSATVASISLSTSVNVRLPHQQYPRNSNWDSRSDYARQQDEEGRKQSLAQTEKEDSRRRAEQKEQELLYQQRLQEHRKRQQATLRHQEEVRREQKKNSKKQSNQNQPQHHSPPQRGQPYWSRPNIPANQHLGYNNYTSSDKKVSESNQLDIYTLVKPSSSPTTASIRVRVTQSNQQSTDLTFIAHQLKTTPYENLVTAIQKPPTVVGATKAYPIEPKPIKTTHTPPIFIPSTKPINNLAPATTVSTILPPKSNEFNIKSDPKDTIVLSKTSPLQTKENGDDEENSGLKIQESTCQTAYKKCEESETCRWHLSELQIKCPLDRRNCHREHCAKAIGRFTRYVTKPIVESLMFCQCSFGDGECKHLQQWMFPQCLYLSLSQKPKWTCTQTMKMCQSDAICRRHLAFFNISCPVQQPLVNSDNGECVSEELSKCRTAVIMARGSYLETPCYCEAGDKDCLQKQNFILPNNPCVELAMLDYFINPFSSTLIPKKLAVKTFKTNQTEVTVLPSLEEGRIQAKQPETFSGNQYQEHISRYKSPSSLLTATAPPAEDSTPSTTDYQPTTSAFSLETGSDSSETEKYLTMEFNDTLLDERNAENSTFLTKTTLDPAVKQTLLKKMNQRKQFRPAKYFLPTGEYVTQRPPPQYGGCTTRNIDGEWVVHYKNSLFRQYHDWSGVCSSWCQCTANETIVCHTLTCLPDVMCEALHTTVRVGERLYLEGRGACLCQSGRFICDTSEELLDLQPGLYISLGYSKEELELIKEKVPKPYLEKSGLVSPMGSVAKDIASRMQFALERVLPEGTMCRIAMLDHFPIESVIMLQLQWYGIDRMANETQPRWHVGKLEKQCSPYVRELEHNFLLEKSDRYQLVLSTVKQLKVVDMLDGLAPSALLGVVASSGISLSPGNNGCWLALYYILSALIAWTINLSCIGEYCCI